MKKRVVRKKGKIRSKAKIDLKPVLGRSAVGEKKNYNFQPAVT